MIRAAVAKGLTPEQIAKALDVDVAKITERLNILDGIHPDAVELLKTKPIKASSLKLFRKAKAVRQIDMAQLMISGNNFTLIESCHEGEVTYQNTSGYATLCPPVTKITDEAVDWHSVAPAASPVSRKADGEGGREAAAAAPSTPHEQRYSL